MREFTRRLRAGVLRLCDHMRYNADGRLLQKTMPEGDQILYLFNEGNVDRFSRQHAAYDAHA